uniref:Uncharacterized protein n=1 Tax=Hazenia capsulata TaxID=2202518 RepID=A0A1W6EHG9_9CHLO|nr:hypothetical protein CCM22_pgp072 [Hazenia capsulata]ARK14820.1 hypothetical protein [Hazenia capsulata]
MINSNTLLIEMLETEDGVYFPKICFPDFVLKKTEKNQLANKMFETSLDNFCQLVISLCSLIFNNLLNYQKAFFSRFEIFFEVFNSDEDPFQSIVKPIIRYMGFGAVLFFAWSLFRPGFQSSSLNTAPVRLLSPTAMVLNRTEPDRFGRTRYTMQSPFQEPVLVHPVKNAASISEAFNTSQLLAGVQKAFPSIKDDSISLKDASTEVGNIATKLVNISTEVEKLATEVRVISTNVNNIATKVEVIPTELRAISTKVNNIATKVEVIPTELRDIVTEIEQMPTKNKKTSLNLFKALFSDWQKRLKLEGTTYFTIKWVPPIFLLPLNTYQINWSHDFSTGQFKLQTKLPIHIGNPLCTDQTAFNQPLAPMIRQINLFGQSVNMNHLVAYNKAWANYNLELVKRWAFSLVANDPNGTNLVEVTRTPAEVITVVECLRQVKLKHHSTLQKFPSEPDTYALSSKVLNSLVRATPNQPTEINLEPAYAMQTNAKASYKLLDNFSIEVHLFSQIGHGKPTITANESQYCEVDNNPVQANQIVNINNQLNLNKKLQSPEIINFQADMTRLNVGLSPIPPRSTHPEMHDAWRPGWNSTWEPNIYLAYHKVFQKFAPMTITGRGSIGTNFRSSILQGSLSCGNKLWEAGLDLRQDGPNLSTVTPGIHVQAKMDNIELKIGFAKDFNLQIGF